MKIRINIIFLCILMLLALPGDLPAAEYKATLLWSKRVKLGIPSSGVVVEVLAKTGDRVKKGDTLVRLDTRIKKARLAQAKADLERQVRLRDEAKKELDRAQELYDRTVLSDHELEAAHIDYAQAEAKLATARAELTRSDVDLFYADFKAPFDGIVIDRFVEVGQTVLNQIVASPLFVFAESKYMLARARVSNAVVSKLERGKSAAVVVDGKKFPGEVVKTGLEPVDENAGDKLYVLDVKFKTGKHKMRSGQTASIVIP